MHRSWKTLAAAAMVVGSLGAAEAQGTLKAVMHSDLKIVDPIWTTAYITRNHGYMVYDTLFAMDDEGVIKPQMIDKYNESADKLTFTFTLRDGLTWHDGAPVTAEDCVASIKRWGAKDSLGQKVMSFVDQMTANDPKTFTIKLKEPTGLLIFALGKPSSNVPFMMPKRVAETDPNTQISDFTGSGPFVFKRDEWKPGDKAVYVKFDKYKPRSEPASGLAGGKVVKVDRVEWLAISDHQQAVNALLSGEIDYIESPPHDLLPLIKGDANVKLVDYNPLGNQYTFRPNHLHKPFDNPKVRQALWYAFNQKDFLQAVIGDPAYYKTCKAMFVCGTPLASEKGMEGLLELNFQKARDLLKEANYDGTPVVLMQSTDLRGPDQPRAGCEIADGARRLQGRHAGDGLADAGRPPRQEGPAERRRLERVPDLLGRRRHPQSGDGGLCQCRLRQGHVRLAVRSGHGEAAGPVRARDRSEEAEGDRGGRAGPQHAGDHAPVPRPMVPADRRPQERQRHHDGAGAGVLERQQIARERQSHPYEANPLPRPACGEKSARTAGRSRVRERFRWDCRYARPHRSSHSLGPTSPRKRGEVRRPPVDDRRALPFREDVMISPHRKIVLALVAVVALGSAAAAQTLRVAPHSDLKVVDPIWTTALISVNHGYMIYDTLFALDDKLAVRPQMVDRHEVSADKLIWTFTLRDGLEWHDGQPVTAEDCVASIRRWGARDTMGQKLLSYVAELAAPDAKTIRMTLKEPYGLVLQTLAKPGANVPFMMPKRVAETDPNKQIAEFVGSGPFIFKRDEWRPGEKVVYLKNPKYKPRSEPASGLAGGKVPKVERVEWIWIADPQTQVNALTQGRGPHPRGAAARPAAAARQGQEHRAVHLEPARPAVRLPLQRAAQAVRQPEGPPGARLRVQSEGFPRVHHRRPGVVPRVQVAVPLRLAAGVDQGLGRQVRAPTSPRPGSCCRRPAMTARRSCCCNRATSLR